MNPSGFRNITLLCNPTVTFRSNVDALRNMDNSVTSCQIMGGVVVEDGESGERDVPRQSDAYKSPSHHSCLPVCAKDSCTFAIRLILDIAQHLTWRFLLKCTQCSDAAASNYCTLCLRDSNICFSDS